MASSQQRTPLKISAASSGNNTLLAAVTGYAIRVHSLQIVAAGAVTVDIQSGATGTSLTGVMSLITGVPLIMDFEKEGILQTAVSTLLNMSLGGAVQVSGRLTYSLVAL